MKSRLMIGSKVATLFGTGWLLIATSPPPPECTPEGPLRFEVTGTCGPAGEVQLSKEQNCDATMAGASAVNLPENAEGFWSDQPIGSGNFRLITFGPNLSVPGGAQTDAGTGQDGGEDTDAGVELDAGMDVDAGVDEDGGTTNLPGREFNTCDVGLGDANGVLPFQCYDDVTTEVVCTGKLTPKP